MYRIPSSGEKVGHIFRVLDSCETSSQYETVLRWIDNVSLREVIRESLREHVISKQLKLGVVEYRIDDRRKEDEEF